MDEKKKIRKKTLIDHMFHLQKFHQLTHIDHLDVSIHTARKKSDTSTGQLEPLVPAAAAGGTSTGRLEPLVPTAVAGTGRY